MAETKVRDGLEELSALDDVFRALDHASRRHILQVVQFRGGEMTAGEIARRFSCSWPTTTRHLKILESSGLLVVQKRGRERFYTIQAERLHLVVGGWLQVFC